MASHLFSRFRKGAVLRQLKAEWLNTVANMWNHAKGGHLINVTVPDNTDNGNGPKWDIDSQALEDELLQKGFQKKSAAPADPGDSNSITSGVSDSSTIDTTGTATFGGSAGTTIHICCRGVDSGADEGHLMFRPFKIAADGRIYSIGAESSGQDYTIPLA